MVQGAHFYQNPEKQRWAKRWLWRRENLNLPDLALKVGIGLIIGLILALGSAIAVDYLGLK
jgi:hypothetical protein